LLGVPAGGEKRQPPAASRQVGNLQPGTAPLVIPLPNLAAGGPSDLEARWRQLLAELPLSLDELALGRGAPSPPLIGEATVQVPAGWNLRPHLRLKRQGWPLKDGRGDFSCSASVLKAAGTGQARPSATLLDQLRKPASLDPRAMSGCRPQALSLAVGWISACDLIIIEDEFILLYYLLLQLWLPVFAEWKPANDCSG